jgi:RNA polymerase sigma factor (sigma-70 family)
MQPLPEARSYGMVIRMSPELAKPEVAAPDAYVDAAPVDFRLPQNTHAEMVAAAEIENGRLAEPVAEGQEIEGKPEFAPPALDEAEIATTGAAATARRTRIRGGRLENWTSAASELAAIVAQDPIVQGLTHRYARIYNRGDASDLMQELVMRLARSEIACTPGDPGVYGLVKKTLGWITTDAIRQDMVAEASNDGAASTKLRRREAATDFDERILGDREAAPDNINLLLDTLVLEEALNSLSVAHREILISVYFRERTVSEAAEQLNLPLGTAKSRIYYAIRALRAALTEMGFKR